MRSRNWLFMEAAAFASSLLRSLLSFTTIQNTIPSTSSPFYTICVLEVAWHSLLASFWHIVLYYYFQYFMRSSCNFTLAWPKVAFFYLCHQWLKAAKEKVMKCHPFLYLCLLVTLITLFNVVYITKTGRKTTPLRPETHRWALDLSCDCTVLGRLICNFDCVTLRFYVKSNLAILGDMKMQFGSI